MDETTDTRTRILQAARDVMLEQGMRRATTREIARAAGVSEGTLYNHFPSKEALFLASLKSHPTEFVQMLIDLPSRAGEGKVADRLAELARTALVHYRHTIPIGSSILADRDLMERHQALLREQGAGPYRANEMLAAYLRSEQEAGRVRPDVDPDTISYMILGACLQYVFWTYSTGEDSFAPAPEVFTRELVAAACSMLEPRG